MKTRAKMENGNTLNEKAVFFKGMGTTVNEDELRNILARKDKSKQTTITLNTNQEKKLTKIKQIYTPKDDTFPHHTKGLQIINTRVH
jgi:hypothetical protein